MNKNIEEFLWDCYDKIPEFQTYVYENISYENQWMDDDSGTDVEFNAVVNFFKDITNKRGV